MRFVKAIQKPKALMKVLVEELETWEATLDETAWRIEDEG